MRITDVETFLVPPRWLFLKLSTDEGISGWGEPIVEGRAATVRAAVHELSEYLVGQDPLLIERHWQLLTKAGFYRGGPILSSAVAGIDQALWDIAGKVHGVPVHALLGGAVRERLRVYAWIGGDTAIDAAELAQQQVEAGFTAVKMNASGAVEPIDTLAMTADVVSRAEAVRAVLGDGRDLAIDFHGRMTKSVAKRVLAALEPVHPLFVEEPVLAEYSRDLRELAASSTVPLATGERLYSRWDFRDVLSTGVAVIQPDISHAGGISETRRIAAMAEAWDVLIAPHCPLGPIALAASFQVAFAIPNLLIQEQGVGIHYNGSDDILDYLVDPGPFQFEHGYAAMPRAAGLGIEVDEQAVRQAAERGHNWRNPVWHHADGSLAEW